MCIRDSSKSFDSNYNYENATDVYDKDVIELVEEWFNECEKKISPVSYTHLDVYKRQVRRDFQPLRRKNGNNSVVLQ